MYKKRFSILLALLLALPLFMAMNEEHLGNTLKAKEVIYNALNENGIAIPFPQHDIHIITGEPDSAQQ